MNKRKEERWEVAKIQQTQPKDGRVKGEMRWYKQNQNGKVVEGPNILENR